MTPCPCEANASMQAFGVAKVAELLDAVVAGIAAAASEPTPDAVHDMRVAIRRLQQCLRVFEQYLPRKGVKRIRREMKAIMDRAGELRNYDIALELVTGDAAAAVLSERRQRALAALAEVVAATNTPELAATWTAALKLEQPQ